MRTKLSYKQVGHVNPKSWKGYWGHTEPTSQQPMRWVKGKLRGGGQTKEWVREEERKAKRGSFHSLPADQTRPNQHHCSKTPPSPHSTPRPQLHSPHTFHRMSLFTNSCKLSLQPSLFTWQAIYLFIHMVPFTSRGKTTILVVLSFFSHHFHISYLLFPSWVEW